MCCGGCHPISSGDMIEFENRHGCDREHEEEVVLGNPEDDVVKMVDKEIYKQIGDVLSEILRRSISNSLSEAIQIDDE